MMAVTPKKMIGRTEGGGKKDSNQSGEQIKHLLITCMRDDLPKVRTNTEAVGHVVFQVIGEALLLLDMQLSKELESLK